MRPGRPALESGIVICPACGGVRIHHSRLRNWAERARWRVTGRAPFRCHDCQWRGWRKDAGTDSADGAIPEIQPAISEIELEEIDPDPDGAPHV